MEIYEPFLSGGFSASVSPFGRFRFFFEGMHGIQASGKIFNAKIKTKKSNTNKKDSVQKYFKKMYVEQIIHIFEVVFLSVRVLHELTLFVIELSLICLKIYAERFWRFFQ